MDNSIVSVKKKLEELENRVGEMTGEIRELAQVVSALYRKVYEPRKRSDPKAKTLKEKNDEN